MKRRVRPGDQVYFRQGPYFDLATVISTAPSPKNPNKLSSIEVQCGRMRMIVPFNSPLWWNSNYQTLQQQQHQLEVHRDRKAKLLQEKADGDFDREEEKDKEKDIIEELPIAIIKERQARIQMRQKKEKIFAKFTSNKRTSIYEEYLPESQKVRAHIYRSYERFCQLQEEWEYQCMFEGYFQNCLNDQLPTKNEAYTRGPTHESQPESESEPPEHEEEFLKKKKKKRSKKTKSSPLNPLAEEENNDLFSHQDDLTTPNNDDDRSKNINLQQLLLQKGDNEKAQKIAELLAWGFISEGEAISRIQSEIPD